jgi:hypothetical protein
MKHTSKLKVRRIWVNTNSSKDQVTVQLSQQVEGSSNPLLALTQGINPTSTITALVSFKAEVAEKIFGTTDFTAPDVDDFNTHMDLKGTALENMNISVVENTTKNPNFDQEPKIDPSNNDVLCYNGKPIYRHTELQMSGPAKIELLQYTERVSAEDLGLVEQIAQAARVGAQEVV